MKNKLIIFVIFSFAILFFVSKTTNAFMLDQGFGGKVLQSPIPLTTCPSIIGGALMIRPSGLSPTGPYDISASQTQKNVRVGSWILGMYNPIMRTTCTTETTGSPVPLPVFPISKYNVNSF